MRNIKWYVSSPHRHLARGEQHDLRFDGHSLGRTFSSINCHKLYIPCSSIGKARPKFSKPWRVGKRVAPPPPRLGLRIPREQLRKVMASQVLHAIMRSPLRNDEVTTFLAPMAATPHCTRWRTFRDSRNHTVVLASNKSSSIALSGIINPHHEYPFCSRHSIHQ